jgi:transcriptional regulator with PAS, ATPase and Fis domain
MLCNMSRNKSGTPHTHPKTSPFEFHGMFSSADCMRELFDVIERVARTESTVLVRGETGTGKELVARAVHDCSPRAGKPFRAINCATLTPELLASELFGHVRGAFTGAIRDHEGLFAQSHTGTIFLDEIAELPLALQAQLLRVLQERSFVPVGGTKPQSVDVRLVAATNKALRTEVAEGRFREDLMYRVRVIPVFLPPLVDRAGDVENLLWRFIDDFNKQGFRKLESIADEGMAAIRSYMWPGNIRELHNMVEYAFAMGIGPVLKLADLPPEIRGEGPTPRRLPGNERERIRLALRDAEGRKAEAATSLGISRSTLWRKMKELSL